MDNAGNLVRKNRPIAILTLGALALSLLPAGLKPVQAQGESRVFPETGQTVKGRFLQYWSENGGLAQQGYPLTGEIQDRSPIDGKTYTMQYFERAVFELHPENQAPNDVLLSLVGTLNYNAKYPMGMKTEKASTDNPYTDDVTGKVIGGKFRAYYESHGGLRQQGHPLSNEFTEKSALDGKEYTVQYFERAVFELHPENQAPYDVLLSQLGTFQYKATQNLSYTDSTNTTVTLTKRPQRIVCLIGICEDILHELGLEPVAVSDMFYKQPQLWGPDKVFPAITGGFASPNLEDIAKNTPDLVIGFIPHIGLRDALKPIAPLYIMNPAKYQDTFEYVRAIGRLTGKSYEAEQTIGKLVAKMKAYKAKSPNNKVPVMLFGNTANFSIFTEGSLFGSVLSEVTNYPWPAPGPGEVGAPDQEPGSLQYSLEKLLQKDPDVLLVITQGNPAKKLSDILKDNPIWGELKAVKNGTASEVPFQWYVAGRGTVSLGVALDDAMHRIYPETFPNPLP